MSNIIIHVDDKEVLDATARMMGRLSSTGLTAFMRQVAAPYFRERADSRFESEGDDASGAWAALKFPTIRIRESQGYPGEYPINIRTRNLRDWVVNNEGVLASSGDAGVKLTWPGGTAGETAEKFETAQAGKKSPATVARPVVAANATDLAFMMSGLEHWIES